MPKGIKGFQKENIPWNKGLKGYCPSGLKFFKKGHIPWHAGKELSPKHKQNISEGMKKHLPKVGFKKGFIPKNKGTGVNRKEYMRIFHKNNAEKYNLLRKERRHRLGISKKYLPKYTGFSKTKQYKKFENQKRKVWLKGGGKLTIQTIQQVYEDNIKQFGTLTCIYCLNPIEFGNDHLEHKTPLSRGGTNLKDNLAIACQRCNLKKGTKIEEEYREEILRWQRKNR